MHICVYIYLLALDSEVQVSFDAEMSTLSLAPHIYLCRYMQIDEFVHICLYVHTYIYIYLCACV